jgi:metal-responsive CopG/Arc/MetJ family transcriptional regulator
MRKSRQLNIRLDDDVLDALEDIRVMSRPIPSRSEVIRRAILAERDRVRKLVEREAAR